ncbi:MAG: immune inhibitor A domain-containing protein [Thermoanaerobaculia bacterium]
MKNLVLCLAALLVAAFPIAAQEETLAPLPSVDGERAAIRLAADEDGEPRLIGSDNFPSPKANEKARLRREAVNQQIASAKKSGRTHQVARGQYVDFPVERTDRVFVMLVEFGTQGGYISSPSSPGLSQTPGPLHNTIAEPNRETNNTTIWQPDYDREHYVDMYFNQMVEYYKAQSSGRYTFDGDVMHWVKVPFNGPRYGSNLLGDASMWTLIADTINTWTAAQHASGKTPAEVSDYLKTFDVADRYDYDHDGDFNEPDGYIDHFQIVHAGAGEETGGGILGADAIWSHRWFAFYHLGTQGPSYNRDGGVQFGGGWGANPVGTTLGSSGGHVRGITTSSNVATVTNAYAANPTGIWVGDYTVQPENGGLGVFAHEYGHDLGLPDHYDTAGGNNGTGYWTIMSSGSYLGEGGEDVGARPGDMSAWDKLQLGWLAYDLTDFGKFSVHKVGPAENTTKAAQALVIPLPADQNVRFEYDAAAVTNANGKAWISGSANNYDASMVRSIDVPAVGATLTMRLAYNIEANWDYAYVSVSTNGGTSWTNLAAAGITTTTNASGQNLGNGITGSSAGAWRNASFNLAAYAGQTVLLRIRYLTDGFTFGWGIAVDDITVGAFADDAETSPNGWTLNRFVTSAGKVVTNKPHYYIAEFRQYRGYDTGLQTGPYAGTSLLSGKVGHYPYQDGLLVTYADSDWINNNTSVHPGEGFALPVDARPTPRTRLGTQEPGTDRFWNFGPWVSTVQTFDATFGLDPTDAVLMPFVGLLPPLPGSPAGSPNRRVQFEIAFPSEPAVPVFSDLNSYWFSTKPDSSVITPQTGTSIRIISTSAHDSFMHLQVNAK